MLKEVVKRASRIFPMPLMAILEGTKECNLRCPYCRRYYANSVSKVDGPENLTPSMLRDMLDKIPTLIRIDFMQEGELLCNPYLPEFLEITSSRHIGVGITTNGTLITPEVAWYWKKHKVNRVSISLDSPSQEDYEKMRPPAKFSQVIQSCGFIRNAGLPLQLNMVLFQENIKDALAFAKLAYVLGAQTIDLARPHFYSPPTNYHVPLHNEENKRILKEVIDFNNGLSKPMTLFEPVYLGLYFRKCTWPFIAPSINLDGSIFACSHASDTPLGRVEVIDQQQFNVPCSNYNVGNITKGNFYKIWYGKEYSALRKGLKSLEKEGSIDGRFSYCNSCSWREGLVC